MRCDGNEPCAACLYALSTCYYRVPTGSPPPPPPITIVHTGPPVNASLARTTCQFPISNIANATSDDFASHHTAPGETSLGGGLNFEPQLDPDHNAAQGNGRSMLHPGSSEQGELSAHGNVMCDMAGMATFSENFFSHFADVGSFEGDWQMPPMVCYTALALHRLY